MTETITVNGSFVVDKQAYDLLIDFIAREPDIFSTDYIGYWSFGEEVNGKDCLYLLYDQCDEQQPSEAQRLEAVMAYNQGKELPKDWYKLDVETAKKVIEAGLTKYGANFIDNYDAGMLDVAVQLALFKSIVYG